MSKGALLTIVFALGIAGVVFFSLARVEPLKLTEVKMERRGTAVVVEGSVENRGAGCSSVGLKIRYYDRRGFPLAVDRLALGALARGESARFHTPGRTLESAASFSVAVDRGANPYGN